MPMCVPRGLKLTFSDCSYFLKKDLLWNPELSHLTSLANPAPPAPIQISPPLPARPETTGGHHAWWDLCGLCPSALLYRLSPSL